MIRKKHIRSVSKYLNAINEGQSFRPTVDVSQENLAQLHLIGFANPPDSGETVLPAIIGPVSRYNANGKWIVHRDQPKEERYVRTVFWRWEQWCGGGDVEECEDFKDVFLDCYPRTLMPPPGTTLTYYELDDGSAVVAGPVLVNGPGHHEEIQHAVNLLLEIFGECDLRKHDLTRVEKVPIKHLNWRLLPPGDHPWDRVKTHLRSVLTKEAEQTQRVIWDRQETIVGLGPDRMYQGLGGFSDYIAYEFESQGLVVLESLRTDNAIYVFGEDWKTFSRMTKSEIVRKDLQTARIIHSKSWKRRLALLLERRKAA